MKKIILFLLLLAGWWFFYKWLQRESTPEKLRESTMVKYTDNLQIAVKKAEVAKDKADEAIKGIQKAIEKGN